MTPEEINVALKNNLQRYRNKEITEEELYKLQRELYQQSKKIYQETLQDVTEGELSPIEVFGEPDVPDVLPHRPLSDVSGAARTAYSEIKTDKLREGYSTEEAERIASAAIDKTIRPATAEFYQPPDLFTSRIVDVEKGLVTDEETGIIRPAEGSELVVEALKRQRLGTIPDIEAAEASAIARAEAEKQRRTDYKAEYVRIAREKQARKEAGLLIEGDALDLEGIDPLGLTGVGRLDTTSDIPDEDIPPMTEEEIQEWLRQQAAKEKREERIGFAGPGDVDVIPYPKLLSEEQIRTATQEPVYSAGIVRETPLGASLRNLNTLPAVIAAAGSAKADDTLGVVETDTYRLADSGDVVDQIAVNIAKMQGLPELFESSENITDYIGETGAWWLGLGLELPIPIGPGLALKGTSAALVGTGRAAGKVGATPVANVLEMAGSPYEYFLLQGQIKRTEEMLKSVGSDKPIKDIVNQYYDKPFERADWIDASLKRNNLTEVSANVMAERLAVLHTIQAGLDAQGQIKLQDIGVLKSSPTYKAIFSAVQKNSEEPIDAFTKANAGNIIENELNKFKEAAKTNRDFARIYNEASEAQKFITEGWKRSETPNAIRSNALTSDFKSELAKVRLSGMSKNNIAKFILRSRRKNLDPNNPKLWEALAKEDVGRAMVNLNLNNASLDELTFALQQTLKVPIRENILNFLPQNLSVVAGSTVVNTSRLQGKQYKSFLNELKRRNSNITFDDKTNVYKVSKEESRELITDLINYAGLDRVRQSESFRTMIDNLAKRRIAYKDRDLIDKVIKSTAAIKHLDGFKLREGGEQYRRAIVSPELRGDVVALSEGVDFSTQISKGQFGKIARDVVNATKAITKGPKSLVPEVGVNINADFITLEKTTNSAVDKVYAQFDKDFKTKSKQLKSPVAALDTLGLDAYNIKRTPVVDRVKRTVKQSFDGNDLEYLDTFIDPRYREQIKRIVNQLEQQGKEVNLQQIILDYELYFTKLDTWQEMLKSYFGVSAMDKRFPDSKGLRKILQPPQTLSLRPTESLILETTYTNFVNVTQYMQKEFGFKTLRTSFTGTPTPPIPFVEFILGSRRGGVVSDLQNEWIDKNPGYRLEYYPQYTSLNMEVNLSPLTQQYNTLFTNLFEDLQQAGVELNRTYLNRVRDDIGFTFANKHYDLVTKVTTTQRKKIVKNIRVLIDEQRTLNPDLSSMQGEIKSILNFPKLTLDRMVEGFIKDVAVDEVPDVVLQKAKDDVWNIFFDVKPVDGKYYADPTLSVVQDTLDDVKAFYKANGLTVGDDLVHGLIENYPLFQNIRNTDYAALYGEELAKSFDELYNISSNNKLRTMINSLRTADASEAAILGNIVGTAVSWGRRSMTQGMLGGFPAPGTRYIGINIFSGPIIMLGTLGLQRTLRALSPRNAFNSMRQALTITQIPDSRIVFTSKGGRNYTAKELRMLEDKYNLGLTRGQIEFFEGQASETLGSGGLTLTGRRVNPTVNLLLRQINPTQRNLFSKFADASDLTYRRATFYSALIDDTPIEQAVDLAKRSLLDYGAMSKEEKNFFNRYTLFWSFNRQILSETINATFKGVVGDAGHSYVASVIRASQKQQNASGAWLEGSDDAHARLFAIFKDKIDRRSSYTFGPSNPYAEAYETYLSIAMLCAGPMFGEKNISDSVLQFFKESQTRPLLSFAIKSFTKQHSQNVPPEIVYTAKSFEIWDELKAYYGIKDRLPSQRRLQEPVFGDYEKQYYLPKLAVDKNGNPFNPREKFATDMFLLTLIGFSRNLRDYSKAAMAADTQPDVKRMCTPSLFGYLLGLETSLPQKDILDIYFQERKRILRDLINLYKEQ